ncbi:MAG: serine hydrolase domain-containing protein [Mycobacteriales bacterium]
MVIVAGHITVEPQQRESYLAGCARIVGMTWSRRTMLGVGAAAVASTLVSAKARPSGTLPHTAALPPYGEPIVDALRRHLAPTSENPLHPAYAGAVALVAVGGRTTMVAAVGDALRYDTGPVELPPARRVAMRPDSVFDLASITKVYTALLALRQVEHGRVDLATPVVRYLPEFTGQGKASVTVSMLLAHTAGLPGGATLPPCPACRSASSAPQP